MELTVYDFVTLFLITPFLILKYTLIPAWMFRKIRGYSPIVRNLIIAFVLALVAGIIVATCAQGFSIRIVALSAAVLACILHYMYNSEKYKSDSVD